MAQEKNVDIVFVVDASASMMPTFEQLKVHLGKMLIPISQVGAKVRLGLVAHNAGMAEQSNEVVYQHIGLGGVSIVELLYQKSANDGDNADQLFTRDAKRFTDSLNLIVPNGDEETLIALDCALDFPFGSLSNTKRVVVLLTDEPLEDGVFKGQNGDKIHDLIDKIHARHINLFCVMPESEQANQLAYADRSEIEFIQGGDGLAHVKFDLLFGQMGKSISVASLQSTNEPPFKTGLYGQKEWTTSQSSMVSSD